MSELTAGIPPQATVILAGGEVNVGAAAGVTVIVLDAVMVLPHASVAVAIVKDGVVGQFIVVGAGKVEITGAVIS